MHVCFLIVSCARKAKHLLVCYPTGRNQARCVAIEVAGEELTLERLIPGELALRENRGQIKRSWHRVINCREGWAQRYSDGKMAAMLSLVLISNNQICQSIHLQKAND